MLDVSGAGCPWVLDVPGCWMSQGAGCLGCNKKIPKLVKFYSSKKECWMSRVLDVLGAGCLGCWMSLSAGCLRVLDVPGAGCPGAGCPNAGCPGAGCL